MLLSPASELNSASEPQEEEELNFVTLQAVEGTCEPNEVLDLEDFLLPLPPSSATIEANVEDNGDWSDMPRTEDTDTLDEKEHYDGLRAGRRKPC